MARPTKPREQKRSVRREIRLTIDEDALLMERSSQLGLTQSDFIRQAALDSKPRHRMATPYRASLIRGLGELGKIGSNINQLTRSINIEHAAGNPMTATEPVIMAALYGIETLSTHLIEELTNGH